MAQKITDRNFSQMTAKGVCFVKLASPFLGPSKNYQTLFNNFAIDNSNIKCFDMDATQEIGTLKDFNIKYVPTLLVLVNGKEVNRKTGILNWQELKGLVPSET